MEKKVICFGEVLWDKLPEGARVGGAPLNVCYHLSKNGISSKIISKVGDDVSGRKLVSEMKNLEIDLEYLRTTDDHPTSSVEVNLKDNGSVTYEIVEDVAWDHITYEERVATAIGQADAFVFGSLVARTEVSRSTLLMYLKLANWVVLDVNLRKPFFSKDIIFDLISHAQTLKINEDEVVLLGEWLGTLDPNETDILRNILVRFPKLNEIILTKGAEGARYYSSQFSYQVPAKQIIPKDTIGSGDSFLAAFLASRLNGKTIEDSMQSAVLLSAFVATQAGACPEYDVDTLRTALM